MRHLGLLHHFLGLEIYNTPTGLVCSQENYARSIIQKAGMLNYKEGATPTSTEKELHTNHDTIVFDPSFYKSIVGCLQYLTITGPDLSFAVNTVCQYMHVPLNSHFQAVKRILRYLKGTLQFGLHYVSGPLTLLAYSDMGWARDIYDRKSTTGYVVYFGQNPILWSAKK